MPTLAMEALDIAQTENVPVEDAFIDILDKAITEALYGFSL